MSDQTQIMQKKELSFEDFRQVVLNDYRLGRISRETSLLGRREVLTGKAKFGIFGDGKEVAQIAMAKVFQNGDFRSGYYRDQTFMMAAGLLTVQEFFAQLYAHPSVMAEPATAGRAMNGHYATRLLNDDGSWKNQTQSKNSSADISPTAGQMPRLLGLALASKFYRNNPELKSDKFKNFSVDGNEVAFGTIGDASTSEGLFFETINAAGVLQVPMVISIWDDGYGISVPNKYQTTKQSISEALQGFARTQEKPGYEIIRAKGWDYAELCDAYEQAANIARTEHVPVMVHIQQMTQPQGHSTSGSHERYKSKERLLWEEEFDCLRKMREFMVQSAIATEQELDAIDAEAKKFVNDGKKQAWDSFTSEINTEKQQALSLAEAAISKSSNGVFLNKAVEEIKNITNCERRDIAVFIQQVLFTLRADNSAEIEALKQWYRQWHQLNFDRYSSQLYAEGNGSALGIAEVKAVYSAEANMVDGREVLLANHDKLFSQYPEYIAFGEVNGLVGQTGGKAIVVKTEEDLDQIDFNKPVHFFSQTTKSTLGFEQMQKTIQQRIVKQKGSLEETDFITNDTLCRQVSNREPQMRRFSSQHDVVVFVSGKKSSNGKALYSVCKATNDKSYFISSAEELDATWFQGINSVGICGATSTPLWLMKDVKNAIEKMTG